MRVAAREARVAGELDAVERRVHRLRRALARAVCAQDVEDRVADAHRRIQRAARILRHVGDETPAQAAQRALVAAAHCSPPTSTVPLRQITPGRA